MKKVTTKNLYSGRKNTERRCNYLDEEEKCATRTFSYSNSSYVEIVECCNKNLCNQSTHLAVTNHFTRFLFLLITKIFFI